MRVERTFVFVDLSGFTNYTASHGDDAAGRILKAFRLLTRDLASARGVRIDKWLGDGCMVVSVDQAAAVVFALELERRSAEVCGQCHGITIEKTSPQFPVEQLLARGQ